MQGIASLDDFLELYLDDRGDEEFGDWDYFADRRIVQRHHVTPEGSGVVQASAKFGRMEGLSGPTWREMWCTRSKINDNRWIGFTDFALPNQEDLHAAPPPPPPPNPGR